MAAVRARTAGLRERGSVMVFRGATWRRELVHWEQDFRYGLGEWQAMNGAGSTRRGSGPRTRSGTRREGDDYQDIVAIDQMLRWFGSNELFRWIKLEADDALHLDDITALKADGNAPLPPGQVLHEPDGPRRPLGLGHPARQEARRPGKEGPSIAAGEVGEVGRDSDETQRKNRRRGRDQPECTGEPRRDALPRRGSRLRED